LKGLGKGISADDRRKVETILAKRVPRPPKTQWERHKRESEESQSEEEPSPEPMFLLRAAQAFALASYEGPSNKRVAKAARQAADVWEELATKLERQQ
jgi:hypothetical protein